MSLFKLKFLVATGLFTGISLAFPLQAQAAGPVAKVSFTFDDGFNSALTQAAPTLAKYGITGTDYVITGCVGMTTAPNTCRADTDKPYMSWDQISKLKNTYGWEIGSHTVNHYCLASSGGDDCQPNQLTPQQVDYELSQSKADLAAHGFNAVDFAPPYGDYNPKVLAQIAKYYQSQRGFADTGYNSWPYSDYLIRVQQVRVGVGVAKVKSYIDKAMADHTWLVLVFHDIKPSPDRGQWSYDYSTAHLDKIAQYVRAKGLPTPNIANGLVSGNNLLPNGDFNGGLGGWTTDDPARVTADNQGHGSYPEATNSAKLVSDDVSGRNVHLFSPRVSVNPTSQYAIKSFLSVDRISAGVVAFYIDEYDANGNWISGQYKVQEGTAFVENINFAYIPTSANVAQASLQAIVTGNSGIVAYVDTVQWLLPQ